MSQSQIIHSYIFQLKDSTLNYNYDNLFLTFLGFPRPAPPLRTTQARG